MAFRSDDGRLVVCRGTLCNNVEACGLADGGSCHGFEIGAWVTPKAPGYPNATHDKAYLVIEDPYGLESDQEELGHTEPATGVMLDDDTFADVRHLMWEECVAPATTNTHKLLIAPGQDKRNHFNSDSSGWWPIGTRVTVREDYMEYLVSGEPGAGTNNHLRFMLGKAYTVTRGSSHDDKDPYVCGMFAYKSRFDLANTVAAHESAGPTKSAYVKHDEIPPRAETAAPAHTVMQPDNGVKGTLVPHWIAECIVTPNLDIYMSDPEFEKVVSPGTEYTVARGTFYNWFDHSGVPYSVHAFVTHFDLVRPPPEEN